MKPHIAPAHDPIAALAYNANGSDVSTVIINGKTVVAVVAGGKVKTVDEN